MGNCKFNDDWLTDPNWSWVRKVDGNPFFVKCSLCSKSNAKNISLSNMGFEALKSHAKGKKHQKNVNSQQASVSISAYLPPAAVESMYFLYNSQLKC